MMTTRTSSTTSSSTQTTLISDGTFIEFECALSDDKHFIREPITLSSCGHSVCKSCLPRGDDEHVIVCKLCGEVTERDLSHDKESVSIKIAFKRNLQNLMSVLERQAALQLGKLKGHLNCGVERIDLKIEYFKNEIDVRIESIKSELDKLNDKFQNELEVLKAEIIKVEYGEIEKHQDEIKQLESNLIELRSSLENKVFENEEKFYEYQDNLRRINEIMTECENYQLEFKLPDDKAIHRSIVGEIVYINSKTISDADVHNRLKISNFDSIGINTKPYYLCVLPNGHLAAVNRYERNITLYDWKFYLIRTVDRIEEKHFSPYEMAASATCVFILDRAAHQIIKTDLDFNKIKVFGSHGGDNTKFNVPYSFCYNNSLLYVCDRMNKRIQILTSELEFHRSYALSYKPRYICVSHKLACVKSYEETETYFYDLDKFTFKHKFSHGLGRLSMINSSFYEICVVAKRAYCYDSDGNLVEDINLSKISNYVTNSWNGHLVCFNSNLIMSCSSQKLFLKF